LPSQSNLKSILKSADPASLQSISEFWGLQPDEPDGEITADFLYPRLQSAQYLRAAVDRLSHPERELLMFVVMHGGELERGEIIDRMYGGDESVFEQQVGALSSKGFVFIQNLVKDAQFVVVPANYMAHIDVSPHLLGYIGSLLRSLPAGDLQVLGENVMGHAFKASLKAGIHLHDLRNRLLDPEFLHDYINALPEPEFEIFTLLLKRKGSCLYRDLLDFASQRKFDHAKAEQLNSLLANRGVVFALMEGHNKYSNLLVIPRDLLYIIENNYQPDKRSMSDLDLLASASDSSDPRFILDSTYALLRDVVIMANYLTSHSVKRLANGGINRNDLKKILPFLAGPKSAKYAMFIAAFLLGRKHLVEVGNYWKVSDSFSTWIKNSRQMHQDLYTWWLSQSEWDEGLVEGISFQSSTAVSSIVKLLELRRLILHAIASLPQDKWVAFTTFYDMIVPQVESSFPQFSGNASRTMRAHPLKATVKNIVEQSLNWLGILLIGHDKQPAIPEQSPSAISRKGSNTPVKALTPKDDEDFLFKPTSLGLSLFRLGIVEDTFPLEEEIADHLAGYESTDFFVQPNLAIIAPPDLQLDRLFNLARFAVIRNVDVMTTLEITRDSMRNALDNGMNGDEIYQFLSESSRMALPETVKHLIDDCMQQHGEARIALAGGFITSNEQYVIEEIRRSSKLSAYIKDVIEDKAIILAPNSDINKIARELRGMGLMPQLESDTVHETKDERYHLTLTPEELYELIAATRLVAHIEEELNVDISRGQALSLSQKLKPEGARFRTLHEYTESTAKTYEKHFHAALDKVIEDVEGKYKEQVAKLVSRTISGRGPSKYNFKGPNPAVEREDIMKLLSFATDYELETEILYIRQNDQEARIMIVPKSFEGKRLYAHCSDTDSDSIYSLDRILRARLL
jgi:hypothetical protein